MKKLLSRILSVPLLRMIFIVAVSIVFTAAVALAQDDPTGFLSALPKDFNYWLLLLMAAAMVAHWAWKKFVKKEPTPDFISWYVSNVKMTATAFGAGALMLVAQWSVLSTQPLFSFPVLTACLTAGWTADSSLNKASQAIMDKVASPDK
jgi:hypothetical protein